MNHMRLISRFIIYISLLYGADAVMTLTGVWNLYFSIASPFNFLVNAAFSTGLVLIDVHRGNLE